MLRCPNCNSEYKVGCLKETQGRLYFKEDKENNEKINNLEISFIQAYKCPTCGKIELIAK